MPFVPGYIDFTTPPKLLANDPALFTSLKQRPSKEATIRVLRLGSWEATGDWFPNAIGIPEVRKHRWFRGDRGRTEDW